MSLEVTLVADFKNFLTEGAPFFLIVTIYLNHMNYSDEIYYWLIKMMAGFLLVEVNRLNNFV